MLTELQKLKVQEWVKETLGTIKDWHPLEKCELAIRAALAVSKSKETSELRRWAEERQDRRDAYKELCYYYWDLYDAAKKRKVDAALYFELSCAVQAIECFINCDAGREFVNSLLNCLANAKLCAMERGEELLISDIIIDINGHELLR